MEPQATTPPPHMASQPSSNVKNLAKRFERPAAVHGSIQYQSCCRSRRQLNLPRRLSRKRSHSLSPTRHLSDYVLSDRHHHTTSELLPPTSPPPPHMNGLSALHQPVPEVCVEAGGEGGKEEAEEAKAEVAALKAELCEARKAVAALTEELKQREQGMKLWAKKLEESGTSRVGKGSVKQWVNWQPLNCSNVLCKLPHYDVVEDPEEIIHLFIEAERIYVDSLHALEFFYYEPLKTLSAFKPDVLSYPQLGSLFLNCSELLVVHRFLLQELSQIPSLPRAIQVEELLTTLERFFPSFPLYGPHLASGRHQGLQKEYRTCQQRPQFKQLLEHCQNKCGGKGLLDFLTLPSERLSDYVSLLSHFLGVHMRNLSDAAVKRAEILVNYLNKLKYGVQEQHSEWEHAQEKTKVLQKLAPEAPVPMEMFEADVELLKQGPLTMVKGNREIPCTGLLFKTYFAIADHPNGAGEGVHLRVLEYGMIPLSTAQLHKCVDVEGQTLQPDLQSGLSEDRMGFRISFKNNDSLFFRVAKPNEKKAWVEALEKCIQDTHPANHSKDETDGLSFSPEVGPKIAAASMEKLFQQLISPQMFRDDFVEVFLMTHSSFTTSKNVLTALINCINSPGGESEEPAECSNTSPESPIFTFNDLSEVTATTVTDVSMAMSSYHIVCTSESENESPSASPSFSRRPLPSALALNQKGEVPLATTGRGVVSNTSTSDSDVSPHTSAIVVDNGVQHGASTQNGWQSSEVFMRGGEHSLYITLCPPVDRKKSHSSDHQSWGDAEDSDGEEGVDGEEDGLPTPCNSISSKMDAMKALKLEDLHEDSEFLSVALPRERASIRGKSADTELDGNRDMLVGDSLSARRSAALCTSEPNLATMGIHSAQSTPSPSHTPNKQGAEPNPAMSLKMAMTTPNLGGRAAQPFYHGAALTAPAGVLREHMAAEKKVSGLRRLAPVEKKPSKWSATDLTASLGGPIHKCDLTLSSGSAQTTDAATGTLKKQRKGIREQIVHRLNKMRGKKDAVKISAVPDEVVASAGTKVRRNSTLPRRPTRNNSLNESLVGSKANQGEEPSLTSSGRSGSLSSGGGGGGVSRYTTLVSKIFSVLNCWQAWHYEDFERDEELKSMLYDFLNVILTKNHSDSHLYRLANHLMGLIKAKESTSRDGTMPSLLLRVTNLNPAEVAMYNWGSLEKLKPLAPLDLSKASMREGPVCSTIAQQMTLMEFAVYKAVERFELLNCNWKKANKERLAPNVCRLIRRTNELTSWVCTEVLSQDTPHSRANVIELFIDVAKCCYRHYDFHCSLNITIALKSSAVKGLTKTWALVDKKSRQRLERLSKLTDYHGRCKKLRETLEQLTEDSLEKNETLPSALPYLGAYLDQIYTLEMSTKTFNPDHLVNFTKMTKLGDLVRTALQYQESSFPFEPQLDMMAYIMSAKRLSENDLYDLSMKLEPRS